MFFLTPIALECTSVVASVANPQGIAFPQHSSPIDDAGLFSGAIILGAQNSRCYGSKRDRISNAACKTETHRSQVAREQ
jgi:hypothetical protein